MTHKEKLEIFIVHQRGFEEKSERGERRVENVSKRMFVYVVSFLMSPWCDCNVPSSRLHNKSIFFFFLSRVFRQLALKMIETGNFLLRNFVNFLSAE